MAKKYVPEGAFLACDKGTSPSTLRVSYNKNTTIYSVPMATEADKFPFFHLKPMGLCSCPAKWATGISCLPTVLQWDNPKDGVKINGNRMLLEDSTCQCIFGGKISIFFDRPSAVAYGLGEGKMPSDYIKEGFDWIEKTTKEGRALRDSVTPDWMKPITGAKDWFDDLSTGLVEGAVDGVVGLGEVIYQVGQDPVGTAEALSGMVKEGYEATTEGISNAYKWTTTPGNLENAANATWDWASKDENWEQLGDNMVKGLQDTGTWIAENPRTIGTTVGQFIPDAVAAVYTGGGSLAATAGKTALKEGAEVVVEKTVKEGVEAVVEKAGKEALEAGAKRGTAEVLEQLAKKEGGDIAKVVTKSVADKAKELLDEMLEIFDPATATTKQKGNFGEIASHENMLKNSNLKRIGDSAPGSLDDKIKKGIDGIYENANPPPKYVIDEAKYNTSQLNPATKDGPQMSDDWINGSDRLENQVGPDKAQEIREALENGEVDRVLSKVDESGKVTTYKLNSNGEVIGTWP